MTAIAVSTIALLIAPLLASAHGPSTHPRPAWLPKVWWAVGMCETHLNWRHNSGTYEGAFGFHYGSWDRFKPAGAPHAAYLATPREQYRAALNIYRRYGFTGWGCHTNGGYRYWMARLP